MPKFVDCKVSVIVKESKYLWRLSNKCFHEFNTVKSQRPAAEFFRVIFKRF